MLSGRAIAWLKGLVVVGLYTLAAAVGYSRSYLQYHTEKQVVVGAAVGVASGLAWYTLTFTVLARTYPWIESSWVARVFLIKDSSPVDDVLLFEYENLERAKAAAASASKKQ